MDISMLLIYLNGSMSLLPGLEKVGTTLLASAGIISVIIGLAAQQTFCYIISGIFIFIYKPFRVGEYVELNNGKNGIVEDINLRFTIIRSGDNRMRQTLIKPSLKFKELSRPILIFMIPGRMN